MVIEHSSQPIEKLPQYLERRRRRQGLPPIRCADNQLGRGAVVGSFEWAGAEPRYISLLERPGKDTEVAIPYFRARRVAVMTLRSQAEIDVLKKRSAQ